MWTLVWLSLVVFSGSRLYLVSLIFGSATSLVAPTLVHDSGSHCSSSATQISGSISLVGDFPSIWVRDCLTGSILGLRFCS
ncbi:hypothetical protein U1Q18_038146 [Sarracenia purpurea var. burkii]